MLTVLMPRKELNGIPIWFQVDSRILTHHQLATYIFLLFLSPVVNFWHPGSVVEDFILFTKCSLSSTHAKSFIGQIIELQNYRIIEQFGLEGAFKGRVVQCPCNDLGYLQPNQVAQSPVQSGLALCATPRFSQSALSFLAISHKKRNSIISLRNIVLSEP